MRAVHAPKPSSWWLVLFVLCLLFAGIQLGGHLGALHQQGTPTSFQKMTSELREAKAMRDSHIVSGAEYRKMQLHVLGLTANTTDGVSAGEPEFPTYQGLTYSPDKHRLQGGSLLTSSCPHKMPHHKVVFIKTHKTASSTLTNLMHRFGYKYGLNFALPKDNMFYGWPHPQQSITSVEPIGLYQAPYDIYASGHSILSDEQMKIVPYAEYITIMRAPVSHFRSSYRYWMVAQSVEVNGGPRGLTPEGYLADVANLEQYNKQVNLVHNSHAFDFGYDRDAVEAMKKDPAAVERAVQALDKRFSVVLITEYLAESLLLLKRKMCWPLEDVVYGAMKVSVNTSLNQRWASTEQRDPLYTAVRDYNWFDTMLYDHFNASLWQQIEQERAHGWDEELAELKAKIDGMAKSCSTLNYQNEDMHRSALEKPTLSDSERLCHLSFTDSKGYCKTLKREQGAPIDEIECYAQRRQAQFGLLRMANAADEALFGVVARGAHALGHQLYVADPAVPKGTNTNPAMPSSYQVLRKKGVGVMFGIHGLRYEKHLFNKLPGPAYTMFALVVQHPLQEFFDSWNALEMSRRLGVASGTGDVSMQAFFQDPSRARVAAALAVPLSSAAQQAVAAHGPCGRLLVNRLACRLGLRYDLDPAVDGAKVGDNLATTWYHQRAGDFIAITLAEQMYESLVLLRQLLCWRTEDFAYINTDLWAQAQLKPSSTGSPLRSAIERFISVDMALYRMIEGMFQRQKQARPAFQLEVDILKRTVPKTRETCAGVNVEKVMTRAVSNYIEKGCLIQRNTESVYMEFFRKQAPAASVARIEPRPCYAEYSLLQCKAE